jgi:hydroxymethylpyrimidine pyrophosphatase-like HAD family hydrolase
LLIEALATDFDGTLAMHGEVSDDTLAALTRFKASGRKLLMVTGRELPDLGRVFPHLGMFDMVVAENGALLYRPDMAEERPLAAPPPQSLIAALTRRRVEPLSIGQVIVATVREFELHVAEALEELGLDWRMILNKDSIMCLPAGVDKASGLKAAAAEMNLDLGRVLATGDAENDLDFFAVCGVSAAVANALPAVKAAASLVTEGEAGLGVEWVIDRVLDGSLTPERAAAL